MQIFLFVCIVYFMKSWSFLVNVNSLTIKFRPIIISLSRFKMQIENISSQTTTIPPTLQIGLTGSIGMGKSAVARHFQDIGIPVFDADAAVHSLYCQHGKAVELIREVFPDAIVDNAVDRSILGKIVLSNDNSLKVLESIVHPLVIKEREDFYTEKSNRGCFAVLYDIPLLFENFQNYKVDYTVVATASESTQKKRVMRRPGMTEDKFASIMKKQMPDAEKRRLANFIVNTDHESYDEAKNEVKAIVESLKSSHPHLWETCISIQQNSPLNP